MVDCGLASVVYLALFSFAFPFLLFFSRYSFSFLSPLSSPSYKPLSPSFSLPLLSLFLSLCLSTLRWSCSKHGKYDCDAESDDEECQGQADRPQHEGARRSNRKNKGKKTRKQQALR